MKKFLLCTVLVFLLASCERDASRRVVEAETPDGQPFHFMPVHENGVTDVTITIAWPMRWAYDTGRNPAVPYIAASVIGSGGTEELKPKDVEELFNDKNSRGGLSVSSNHVIGELSFPKEHIKDIIAITNKMLVSPQFDPAWVNRIKRGFLARQAQSQKQTASKMWAVARRIILGDSPLNNFLSLPDLDTIENVSVDNVRQWHDETIIKNDVTIAVVGAISRRDAGKAIDQLLSGLPSGQTPTTPSLQPDFSPRNILLHLPDAEKTTIGLVGPLPPTSEGGDLTDLLALNFFARPGEGSLFNAIRTDLRASYGLEAGFTNYDRSIRFMLITGEVETAKLAQASNLIRATYDAYRSNPDLTGLSDLRQVVVDGTAKNMLNIKTAARVILELALDGRDPADAPRLAELLETITAKDVEERLLSAFPPSNSLIMVAASPDADALPGACIITELEQISQCP